MSEPNPLGPQLFVLLLRGASLDFHNRRSTLQAWPVAEIVSTISKCIQIELRSSKATSCFVAAEVRSICLSCICLLPNPVCKPCSCHKISASTVHLHHCIAGREKGRGLHRLIRSISSVAHLIHTFKLRLRITGSPRLVQASFTTSKDPSSCRMAPKKQPKPPSKAEVAKKQKVCSISLMQFLLNHSPSYVAEA